MILNLISSLAIAHAGWDQLPPLPEPDSGFMAGCVNGKIIVAGGTNWRDGVKRWLDTVWLYDPAKNAWSIGPKLPHSLAYAAFASDGTRLFFAGGADGKQGRKEVYALDENLKLTQLADLPQPVVFAGAAIRDGLLHILGGTPDPDDWTKAHAQHRTVNLTDGSIASLPALSDFKHGIGLPAMATAGSQIFALTGAWFDAQQQVHNIADAVVFEKSWHSIAPYPLAARGVAAVALDNTHLYLSGGYGTDEQGFLAQAWLYDIEANTYRPATPQPIAASNCLVQCGEFVYCLGGEDMKKHRTDACHRIRVQSLLTDAKASK